MKHGFDKTIYNLYWEGSALISLQSIYVVFVSKKRGKWHKHTHTPRMGSGHLIHRIHRFTVNGMSKTSLQGAKHIFFIIQFSSRFCWYKKDRTIHTCERTSVSFSFCFLNHLSLLASIFFAILHHHPKNLSDNIFHNKLGIKLCA